MKKWMLYPIVFISFLALAIGFVWLNKHVLKAWPDIFGWLIAIVAAGAIALYYFGKPLHSHAPESKIKSALRCLSSIILGILILYFLNRQRGQGTDFPFWITIMAIGSIFTWCTTRLGNNKAKHVRDPRNLYM